MFSLSSLLHLRLPFSYLLLPIFLFSLAISPNITENALLWTFLILHIFLYPASNAYNSYFDKDEKSIGVLKNPPPVKKGLYYLALLFDVIAILLGYLIINATFAVMLFIYGVISKAYSHPAIRLKKYAIISWIITGLIQGFFTFMMCYVGINQFEILNALKPSVMYGGLLTSIMLWANYPMTQVYQHEEDAKRGDNTLSIMLGIKGTFFFTGAFFGLATLGFVLYFAKLFSAHYAVAFIICLSPVVLFYLYWLFVALKNEKRADYKHAMWLNFISATCLNGFFIYFFLDHTQILSAFQ